MKLEVGKYIRTPFGIRKIVNIKKDEGYGKPRVKVIVLDRHLNTNFKYDYMFYTDEKVIKECKASNNIIDLIEVGDYVNGYKVINTGTEELGHKFITLDFNIDCDELHWGECTEIENSIDIKSIVTKEQFESMSYKVD